MEIFSHKNGWNLWNHGLRKRDQHVTNVNMNNIFDKVSVKLKAPKLKTHTKSG